MKLTEEVAKEVYRFYAVTTATPKGFDEIMPSDGGGMRDVAPKDWQAYVTGIVSPTKQIDLIRSKLSGNADYDKGFFNAMTLVASIFSGDKNPSFINVPGVVKPIEVEKVNIVTKKKKK